MMFLDRVLELLKEKKVSKNKMLTDLGLGKNSFVNWENRGTIPNGETLSKISNYFGVTTDYLLGEVDKKEKVVSEIVDLNQQKVRLVPLFETVSAGFGAFASNHITDYIPCYIDSDSEARETIAIKVQGDSMFPKIEPGDTIIVHKQDSVDSGSVAVVLLDGEEGLVKKVVYGADWIELHSFNPMYPVRRFEGPQVLRLRVVGLVQKVIKDL